VALLGLAAPLVASDPTADARFRADDGNLWHLGDNPAAWGLEPGLAAGYSWSPELGNPQGQQDVVLFSPLLNFRLIKSQAQTRVDLGTGVALGSTLVLGYKSSQVSTADTMTSTTDFGVVWRPWDLLSLAATADNAFGGTPVPGVGIAFRPLALWPVKAPWVGFGSLLTLTADLSLGGSQNVDFENFGARLQLPGGWDLRGWFQPATGAPGFEVTWNQGFVQSRVSVPAVLAPTDLRAGVALVTSQANSAAFGAPWVPQILRLRDVPALAGAPSQPGFLANLLGVSAAPTVDDLLDVLEQARLNPRMVAVAFENPPALGGLADYQVVGKALDRLREAGKKVYVYADAYSANGAFQALWSRADRVVLNPNGALDVHALQTQRLYLKDLFDKLGVRFYNLAPWDTKSYSNDLSFASMPAGERAMNLRLLGQLQSQFSQALAQGRGQKLHGEATDLVNAGPYLIPGSALTAGLIDAVDYRTGFEDAVKKDYPGADLVDDLSWPVERPWGPSPLERRVAVVTLAGDVVLGSGVPGISIGNEAAEQLALLRADDSVAALLLRVDSPGGVVITSDVIADEVRKTVAAGKTVAVVLGNTGASGGYYLSAPASRIFASPGTVTGSIGVTAVMPSFAGALDKLGIHPDAASLAPTAGFADPYRELRPADLKALGDEIASIYQRFVEVVAKGRHLSEDQVKLVGEGQVWTGQEALTKGLVDDLGGLDAAKSWLEAQLGGRVAYFDVLPGLVDASTGLDQLLPTSGVVKQVQALAGPSLTALDRLGRLGVSGPLPAALIWAPLSQPTGN
jgi:protease-4